MEVFLRFITLVLHHFSKFENNTSFDLGLRSHSGQTRLVKKIIL